MASSHCLDLYARQDVRMYCVKQHQPKKLLPFETENIELEFEFLGIDEHFAFDKSSISLNTVILVNAMQQAATLSTDNPVVRVVGYQHQETAQAEPSQQFLHMLRPSEDQLYGNMQVEVRRMAADRFNQGRLLKSLNYMLSKYYSDYYAFMNISGVATDKVLNGLAQTLGRLAEAVKTQNIGSLPGVYLMLKPSGGQRRQQGSIEIHYMTTSGAAVNEALNVEARFIPPSGFDSKATNQIAAPVPGYDEIRDERALPAFPIITWQPTTVW